MARFTGKAIVVTGGSSGIGLATAARIVAEGGRVLVTGTNPAKLAAVKAEYPAIHIMENDAADPEAANAMAAEAKRIFGEIDGVFLNAGVGAGAPIGKITAKMFHQIMDLNVGGVLFGAQAMAPLIRPGGSILITASVAKDKGMAGAAVYSASKGAVASMARGLARELAMRPVRVNTLSPGPIETPFFERLGRPKEAMEMLEKYIKASNPMGRMGKVEEAAAVAVFLLSDEASYVTGSDYPVDGGEGQL
jgi:NAD(P)-dependent dehydrogenase (short-subunit alcohol dehydrogenase family)